MYTYNTDMNLSLLANTNEIPIGKKINGPL